MTVAALLLFKNGMYKRMIVREATREIKLTFINPLAVMNCFLTQDSKIDRIPETNVISFIRKTLHGEFAIYEEEVEIKREKK
jgi:hypothetical protein